MFNNPICNLDLASDYADALFPAITGDRQWNDDESFLATMRAVISPILEEGSRIQFFAGSFTPPAEAMIADLPEGLFEPDTLKLIELRERHASAFLETLKTRNHVEGFSIQEDVSAFFEQNGAHAVVYTNTEMRCSVVFTCNLTMRGYHLIEAMLSRLLPWLLPTPKIDEDSRNLLRSLSERTSTNYTKCIRILTDRFDLREPKLRRFLTGFSARYTQNRLQSLENDIISEKNNLSAFMERLNGITQKIYRLQTALRGYELHLQEIGSEDEDLIQFFAANKAVNLLAADGDTMHFLIRCYLNSFDPDEAERYINRHSSYLYDGCSNVSLREKLLKKIFVEESIRVRFCAAYRLACGRGMEGLSHYEYGVECDTYMPNPHIQYYSCIGTYAADMAAAAAAFDVIGSANLAAASAGSFNFGDSIVGRRFTEDLFRNYKDKKILELSDGTLVSVTEALRMCEENNETKEAEE